jgi:rubrerythrin
MMIDNMISEEQRHIRLLSRCVERDQPRHAALLGKGKSYS